MGYTSYWKLDTFTEADAVGYERALPAIRDIIKRHRAILAFEYNKTHRPPLVGPKSIHALHWLADASEMGDRCFRPTATIIDKT